MSSENVTVWYYDAFSAQAGKGNPAGVVPNADGMSEADMQNTAQALGFNETVFICKSSVADYRFRFFTPGHEISLCGHGTIASVYHLNSVAALGGKNTVRIETNAGIIESQIHDLDGICYISMEQAAPEFVPFTGDIERLVLSVGIERSDIDTELPIVFGSTGTWTLLIPIRSIEAFSRMKPQNDLFPQILTQKPHCSVHPFCLSAHAPHRHIHSRHFSSPYSGTIEDAVTGTASGAIGAYYATYIDPDCTEYSFVMEQGQEIGRDGEVSALILRHEDRLKVSIAGTAVFVKKRELASFHIDGVAGGR